jgi:hypothetical protein
MAIVTTYVCDVTGKSGANKEDFVTVEIRSNAYFSNNMGASYSQFGAKTISKLVHLDIAKKLNLVDTYRGSSTEVTKPPEVSFEGKLKALLEDFVQEIVEGNLENRG